MKYNEIFKSYITNKKILLVEPGNTLHTISFTGLNFEETTKYDRATSLSDFEKIKNKEYDYIFIHGFLARRIHNEVDINIIKNLNISTDKLVVDYLGEGYSIPSDIVDLLKNIKTMFQINQIHFLTPIVSGLETEEEKYTEVKFFKYPIAGPKVFCSPYNFMLHDANYNNKLFGDELTSAKNVYSGLTWNDSVKEYKFMCLNNRKAIHRSFIVNDIIENGLHKYGIVSSRSGDDIYEKYNLLYQDRVFDSDINIQVKNYFIEPINDFNLDAKFGPNIHLSSNSYIDLVTETHAENLMFITEKSMKPFFNLQFPLIFGPVGIVEQLRNYGFDMFDDIINHDYDELPFDIHPTSDKYSSVKNAYLFEKSKVIFNELKRLCNLDLHKIYTQHKNRFIKNQELVNKICIDDNNLLEDVGIYIFNKDIIIKRETEFNKVYL